MTSIVTANASTAWSVAEPDLPVGDAWAECECPEACRLDHEQD
ncbi:MAG TPA: hypothetical protein VG276_08090 [Actinomycetes bacterium]|jgi:hypothetical protein|nr:hypothetical protein [Actinomycetes bacterium]